MAALLRPLWPQNVYVRGVRALRSGLARAGLLAPLDHWASRSRFGVWSRSLLAIHDLRDFAALDLPWWTFAATDRVARFLAERPGARVFEWGAGASTLWLARRAGSVTSVDHDPAWGEQLAPLLPANARLRVVPAVPVPDLAPAVRSGRAGQSGIDFSDYVAAIESLDGDFDLLVVDGRCRELCLVRALDRLAPGGLILFDNLERVRYRRAIAALGARLKVEWTFGPTPCLPYPTITVLLRVPERGTPKSAP